MIVRLDPIESVVNAHNAPKIAISTGELDSVNARKVMCCLEVDVLGLILVSKIIRFVQLMVDVYA